MAAVAQCRRQYLVASLFEYPAIEYTPQKMMSTAPHGFTDTCMNDLPELSGPETGPASGGSAKHHRVRSRFWCRRNDLISLGQYFAKILNAAFISPNAPYRCNGSPFGYQYDVWMQDRDERLAAIRSTAAIFDNFINQQLTRHGLTEKDLVLVGFSEDYDVAVHGTAPGACSKRGSSAIPAGWNCRLLKEEIRSNRRSSWCTAIPTSCWPCRRWRPPPLSA